MELSETNEVVEKLANQLVEMTSPAAASPTRILPSQNILAPQSGGGSCGCGSGAGAESGPPTYVYAIGRIEMRFSSLALEKEFAQATGRSETAGLTDGQTLYTVLSNRAHRYLARQMCWVMSIEGIDTYLLYPRDAADYDLLLDSIRATPKPWDVDVVIGVRGPNAPPEVCNGLMAPMLLFDQMYSFDRDELLKAIPRPKDKPEKAFRAAAEELFERLLQVADNAGATDEHRALNYLAVRYPAIYTLVTEQNAANASLTSVEVVPSRLKGLRNIVDVVFSFTNRNTDVAEKYFVRVDVTEEFPFLVTKLSRFYDR